jgi:hypothetical protein
MHLIDKHMFPKDYDFFVVNDGIDRRTSMLRSGRHRRKSSAAQHATEIEERARRRSSTLETANTAMEEKRAEEAEGSEETAAVKPSTTKKDVDMEDLSGAMSSLKFVPPSVRFGRGGKRGGFSRS